MFDSIKASVNSFNEGVNKSRFGKFFGLEERGSTLTREFQAGTATFLTMAYVLAVNPRIMAESGGTCDASEFEDEGGIFSEGYEECLVGLQRQYVTATALGSLIGCLLMGFGANLPIALAPGMGMNAYFTYSVVGWRGTGSVPYRSALTAVLIEGFIFLVLSASGARFALAKLIPEPLRYAIAPGIGAFLAHLGLQSAEGLGIVVSDIATAVTLGGCPEENRTPLVAYDDACANEGICVLSEAYTCDVLGGKMTSATVWLGLFGMFLMGVLLCYKKTKNSSIVCGILFVTLVSWFRNTAVTFFPETEAGEARFDYFKQVVNIEPINELLANYSGDLKTAGTALVTFFFIDFLDTTGTLLSVVDPIPGVAQPNGDFARSRIAFSVDAVATIIGSVFGLSPVTSYIESGAGVFAGGRTGLTAIAVGLYFGLSIFFAPVLSSIPPWATGGALVVVGSMMFQNLTKVQWDKFDHGLTAFVTVLLMPLTYSIAYGIIGGFMVWVSMQIAFFILSKVFGIERDSVATAEQVKVGNPDDALAARSTKSKDYSSEEDEESGGEDYGKEKEELEMGDRRESLADMRMVSKANESLRLGGGALVSFPIKYIHPHSARDAAYPVRKTGQRLTGAGVLKQGTKSINGEQVLCVIVHHQDFRDENGVPIELWVKKSHVKIEKEGNPEMLY